MQINRILPYLVCLLALFSIIFFSSSTLVHPFYVSMTEIKVDTVPKTVTVSCRMFTDDLQDALYKDFKLKREIKPGDEEVKAALKSYINKNLKVFVGKEEVVLKFIGFEQEEESTWAYLEGDFKKSSKKISVKNSLLYAYIPGQSNLMHCYLQEVRKSDKLNNPKVEAVFEY